MQWILAGAEEAAGIEEIERRASFRRLGRRSLAGCPSFG
jgi:hypothetical protein